jgi:AcrR family transcriptional regulator
VPYRPTPLTEARKAEARERILRAARDLIAGGGYREAQVSVVASKAGVATGTVYRHFPSKADLFSEVFRRASQREVDVMAEIAADPERATATAKIAAAVETFARRALAGRRLAFALLAEPVDPAIEAERLAFRRAYRDVFARVLEAGVRSGELPPQDVEVTAAALVGGLGEALVGPLSPTSPDRDPHLIESLVEFCIRAVTHKEIAHVHA